MMIDLCRLRGPVVDSARSRSTSASPNPPSASPPSRKKLRREGTSKTPAAAAMCRTIAEPSSSARPESREAHQLVPSRDYHAPSIHQSSGADGSR